MKQNISTFIQPFVEELESLYVQGINCRYNYPCRWISNNIPNLGTPTIRAMLMLLTGDHRAQYKISNFKSSSKSACRRCKTDSTLNEDGRYVYGNNARQVQHLPTRRTSFELHTSVCHWRVLKNNIDARTQHSMESRISGDSKLWRLYHLYNFDLSQDLVFDVMHIAGLNLFKNYTMKLFEDIEGHENKRTLLETVTSCCDFVTEARTFELKQGQWPYDPVNDHGRYTAKEYQHFVLWMLPIILNKLDGKPSEE